MNAVDRLIGELRKLPGVGERTARRMTFFILKQDREESISLAKAIVVLKDNVGYCSICFNVTEQDPCSICSDPRRDHKKICVVEEASDVIALEKASFNGIYHVLGGALSPLDGIGPEDLKIEELIERVKDNAEEVIIACNPTVDGQATAIHLAAIMTKILGLKVSQLSVGLPMGGALELSDEVTLSRALEGRQKIVDTGQ